MNKVRATVGVAATTAMVVLAWMALRPGMPPATADEPAPPAGLMARPGPPANDSSAVGNLGCSGIACHGGPVGPVDGLVPRSPWTTDERDRERWRSSATVWKCYDPHARAYKVLHNKLSKRIEARLATGDATPQDAWTHDRCLACHVNPTLANQPKHPLHTDGIGCESCHGNGSKWLPEHAGWVAEPGHKSKLLRAEMTNLADTVVRAETCVGCHVGAPANGDMPQRDVNHDLIAAGHPRLNFDYLTYLRALPPHWAEMDRDVDSLDLRPATDELRHWLIGQTTATAARYRLLADRAKHGPWPELAEFDCYSCHQGLTSNDKRAGGLGKLVWREPLLSALYGGTEINALRAAADSDLSAENVQKQATLAANHWAKASAVPLADPTNPKHLARMLADIQPRRWDDACQLYYGLRAIDRAMDPLGKGPEDPRLQELRAALLLPRHTDGVRFNSPAGFDPQRLPFSTLFLERAR